MANAVNGFIFELGCDGVLGGVGIGDGALPEGVLGRGAGGTGDSKIVGTAQLYYVRLLFLNIE